MFSDTLGKLQEGGILGFGFIIVWDLKQPSRGLGPRPSLGYVGVSL